jgi:DeoR/GlpR family transcriptional regulator of sugar metabolism
MGEIITKHGERGKLARLFKVSEVTIRSALKGRTQSELAARIRKVAIDNGGAEMEIKPIKKI